MPQFISRRDFLGLAGLATAAGVAGLPNGLLRAGFLMPAGPTGIDSRVLVVLELTGGNDGFSMAPPIDLSALAALRPNALHGEDSLIRLDNDVALHPALIRLGQRPLALVDGLGSTTPDLSHFAMLSRWWTGDADGTAWPTTGILGRLCDALDAGAPATGVSIGAASSPALVAEHAGTIGLPDPGWLWWMGDDGDEWADTFRAGLDGMTAADADDGPALAAARRNLGAGLRIGSMVGALPEQSDYPDSELGAKFALASQLLAADLGVRVVHLTAAGDYDTHENHRDRHDTLMAELDEALDAFLGELDGRGDGDQVLVATISEFGRRPEENDSQGLDHGTATTALLAGAVTPGRWGDPPSFTDLDDDANVTATVSMDRYYATLAEAWLGVPASDVLAGSPDVLDGIVA